MSEPKFTFKFENESGNSPLYFGDPDEVIVCTKIHEILPAINKIEAATKKGYYAGGFISYEAAPAFEKANVVNKNPKMPLLWFGIFKEPLPNTYEPSKYKGDFHVSNWSPTINYYTYKNDIAKIKNAIRNGETYQVNYTMRLRADFEGSAYEFYNFLHEKQEASYSAFLDIGRYKILSVSPELFFYTNNHEIITKPMKGTVKRGRWLQEDLENENWLRNSMKNQAENLMIVDLLRNDLGKIAIPGTVKVPKLFEIEKYPTVFQMTSTVTATTRPEIHLVDILKSLFPCGSITGAPKINTMHYINTLEKEPREVYCGTVGLIMPNGESIFNVAIRTVLIDQESGMAEYSVGGGITWDSTSEDEYSEAITKAAVLTENITSDFQLIEIFRLENGEFTLFDEHLKRLFLSIEYFDFKANLLKIEKSLVKLSEYYTKGIYSVIIFVLRNGENLIKIYPLEDADDSPFYFLIAKYPINSKDRFLYHQTTNRFPRKYQKNENIYDVLLWNEYREIIGFSTGNVIFEIDDSLWTPPKECGVLTEVIRDQLVANGEIKECVLTLDEISKVTKFYHLESLYGLKEIKYTLNELEGIEV